MSTMGKLPHDVDLSKPSIARVYDAMLGGKDNFEADRLLLDQLRVHVPSIESIARENRAWVRRVVRWLVREAGIDQILDLGSGLPTAENTHQVAQATDPDTVVVYVDNDPAVIAHGRALLESNDRTHVIEADFTRPDELLARPDVTACLDLDRPVGVLHCLTLHHVADDEVGPVVAGCLERVASGSYLAFTHARWLNRNEPGYAAAREALVRYAKVSPHYTPRTYDRLTEFVAGLELLAPGIVPIDEVRPGGPPLRGRIANIDLLVGGVARKP